MKITNTSAGPRGFYHGDDLVMLERGETWEGDLNEADEKAADATGYFGFGNAAAKKAAQPESDDPIEAARREVGEKAQAYIDELKVQHADEMAIANERADAAETALAQAQEEIATLKAAADKTPPSADDIRNAVGLLDAKNDDHWTAAGLPKVEAVEAILGSDLKRADIEAAAPDAKRPTE